MKHYQEITLLPGVDVGLHFLWEKVYRAIHLGLVEQADADGRVNIGIGLPEFDNELCRLGQKLRLHAEDEGVLQDFDAKQRLKPFADYVHVTRLRPIPETVTGYAIYSRVQPKSSKPRLARRRAKRRDISFAEAMTELEGFSEHRVRNPYIYVRSHSSDQRFPLFIQKRSRPEAYFEGFNSYGLSSRTTIPEF